MGLGACHSELGGGTLNESTDLRLFSICITAFITPSVTVYFFVSPIRPAALLIVFTHLCQLAGSSSVFYPGGGSQVRGSRPGDWGLLQELVGPQEWSWSEQGLTGVPPHQAISTFLALSISALGRERVTKPSLREGWPLQTRPSPGRLHWPEVAERYGTQPLCMLIPDGFQANIVLQMLRFLTCKDEGGCQNRLLCNSLKSQADQQP